MLIEQVQDGHFTKDELWKITGLPEDSLAFQVYLGSEADLEEAITVFNKFEKLGTLMVSWGSVDRFGRRKATSYPKIIKITGRKQNDGSIYTDVSVRDVPVSEINRLAKERTLIRSKVIAELAEQHLSGAVVGGIVGILD